MNLKNFKEIKKINEYDKLEKKVNDSIKSNDIHLMAMTMLSIAQSFLDGRIKIKESNDLFSKYLAIIDSIDHNKLKEIIRMGSSVNINIDPDENVRRIRDMIKTI